MLKPPNFGYILAGNIKIRYNKYIEQERAKEKPAVTPITTGFEFKFLADIEFPICTVLFYHKFYKFVNANFQYSFLCMKERNSIVTYL